MEIKKVSIVGMGALGLLFGSHISENSDCELDFVMDKVRYEKLKNTVFTCNDREYFFKMTKACDAEPADLLIVAVKYNGLEDACRMMEKCVGKDTIIISVLNGITSEKIIGRYYGMDRIIYTVAQGMDAMKFGNGLKYTQTGELRIGMTEDTVSERFESLISFFEKAKLPYVVEEDILYRMWGKFMLNVGVNQTCMVYGTDYSGVLCEGEPNRMLIAAMREVIALANAENIELSEKDLNNYIGIIKTLSPTGTPSMGQDRINRKHSEVEMFAGTVIELAQKHDIYVPANEFLYKKVKEIESEY